MRSAPSANLASQDLATALQGAAQSAARIASGAVGVGCDLVHVGELAARLHPRFLERAFTASEIAAGQGRADSARFFGARWAAKEAGYKAVCQIALAAGRDFSGLATFRHYEVVRQGESTAPALVLHGGPAALLAELGHARPAHISLSLTDEGEFAAAFVVIALPEQR